MIQYMFCSTSHDERKPKVRVAGRNVMDTRKSLLCFLRTLSFFLQPTRSTFKASATVDLVVRGAEWNRERKPTRAENQAFGDVLGSFRKVLSIVMLYVLTYIYIYITAVVTLFAADVDTTLLQHTHGVVWLCFMTLLGFRVFYGLDGEEKLMKIV